MRSGPAAVPLTRRTLLAGLAGGALAACTGTPTPIAAPSGSPASASPPASPAPPTATGPIGMTTPPASPTRAAIATASRSSGTAAATPVGAGPRLAVTPATALLDAPVTIRLTGLAPGQQATLRARSDIAAQLLRGRARAPGPPAAAATSAGRGPRGALTWAPPRAAAVIRRGRGPDE